MRANELMPAFFFHIRHVRWEWIFCLLLVSSFLGVSYAHATALDTDSLAMEAGIPLDEAPRVYIDCGRCDYNHIRREIPFLNYVREPERADVHVFVTNQGTGGGGREYELSFIGREDFNGLEYTLMHTVDRNESWDEERDGLNEVLKMGFGPYLMQTPLAEYFSLDYDADQMQQGTRDAVQDRWDNWVFEVYAGRLQTGLESNQSFFDARWGFFADRVTEGWKHRLRPFFNFDYMEIQRGDDEEPVTRRRHRHGFDSYAIKSLTDHWSVGLFGDYRTRNDRNIRHRFQFNPGVEYSLFPYDEATRRAVTFTYQIGFTRANYYEETIFSQMEESLVNHRFEAAVRIRQPWGNVQGGLVGSHYLHDVTHRRAELWGRMSVRLTDGLSLNFQADFEMIQDQMSLPMGDASLEDVLLQQRELATDFSLSGSIALSYQFGSDFANVVNTRF